MTRVAMPRAGRAFTLAEMAMAMVVMSVVLAVTGSLIVMSSKAAAKSMAPADDAARSREALKRLLEEARYAVTVNEATATALEFTVADRNADGQPETIRYAWSGAGQPLTRAYNGGAATAVSPRLSSLALSYEASSKTTSTTVDSTSTSGETLLSSFTGWSGITPTVRENSVGGSAWTSQWFKLDGVSIPAGSTVTLTRVRFIARSPGGSATMSVDIRQPSSSGSVEPGSSAIGSVTSVPVSGLSTSQAWVSVNLSGVTFASSAAADGLCMVLRGSATNAAYTRYYYSTLAGTNDSVFLYSTNAGSSWSPTSLLRTQNDQPYEVYGTYTSATRTTTSTTTYKLLSVTGVLTPVSGTALRSSVDVLNAPAVAAGVDPTPTPEEGS